MTTTVTEKRICQRQGCDTPLLRDNKNAFCGPCITKFIRENRNEPLPQAKDAPQVEEDARLKPVCVNGHDTAKEGRNAAGGCKACNRERQKKNYWTKKHELGEDQKTHREEYVSLYSLDYFMRLKRASSGASWADVAAKTGISQATLKGYGRLKNRCPISRARKIADCFDVTLGDLRSKLEKQGPQRFDFYVRLGALNHLRQKAGVTWPALAREMDLPESRLTDWGSGEHGCPPDTAQRIADYFGVALHELKGEG